ncbi:protein artichoke-like [Paramacrobiotus metropolitanus]|uniref:protein artichoke-like n=1 Tax=Paramacrobiotus metropolitanus TaxID=2943436 RepID=UPI0024465C5A|nr:protein artichoke-like [Paramacrobiotus metropolitanus]
MIHLLPILCVFSFIIQCVYGVCTHLPSGLCFVDCTQDTYIVVCEGVDGNQLQADLQIFAGLNRTFTLHIWNAPAIQRLGGITFLDVRTLLVELQMQNLENLEMFPEVLMVTVLKRITIQNTPKMKNFPLELLPVSVERIDLHRTGIEDFQSDYNLQGTFPNMKHFRVRDQNVGLLDQYFLAFPNIESIEIFNNEVHIGRLDHRPLPFVTVKPLKRLLVRNNTFITANPNFYYTVFHDIITSLTVDEGSDVEISHNGFPIGKQALTNFNRLSPVKRLSLRGSHFESYSALENLFINFTNLQYLDFGLTNLPIFRLGIFRGLPNLEILKLDGNNIRDIEYKDFFQNLTAKNLSWLDLSDNQLTTNPFGYQSWARNLVRYELSGNEISKPLFAGRTQYFSKLRIEVQSHNRRTTLNSTVYKEMPNLQVIDLSCNNYMNITKIFFSGISPNLKMLNMSFCPRKESQRVQIAKDAFSEWPTIRELYLNRAFLRSNFFQKLQKMPAASAKALRVLHLAHNKIAYLHGTNHFIPFTELEYLDLEYNRLQSTGPKAFSPLKGLRRLNLANNGLFSIGSLDFAGLENLEDLDLSANKLLLLQTGAFDMLPKLRALFLHDNSLPEVHIPMTIFGPGKGGNLTHVSVRELSLRCLNPMIFTKFSQLKWVYLNDSIPLFASMDPVLDVQEQLQRMALHPWADLRLCEESPNPEELSDLQTSFIRVQVADNDQAVYQDLFLHFSNCYQRSPRNIKQKVEDTLCHK